MRGCLSDLVLSLVILAAILALGWALIVLSSQVLG